MGVPTLRPKNQVTLPAGIVAQAGIQVGEPLEFTVEDGRVIIGLYSGRKADESWYTPEVIAEIDRAIDESPGGAYPTAADAIAALKRE